MEFKQDTSVFIMTIS